MTARVDFLALSLVAAGCGRVGFDAITDGNDATSDAALSSIQQQAYLKASNAGAGDHFGNSVTVSASRIVVGASLEDSAATGVNGNQSDNSATDAGAAYVFVRAGASWVQEAYLKASNTDAVDRFGLAVRLSGDGSTLVVGAFGEDSIATGVGGNEADNSLATSGAVYVFGLIAGAWTQQAYIKASNAGAGDEFGRRFELSADGSLLAVSADLEDSAATGVDGNQLDDSAGDAGAVYVFARSGGVWSQQAYLKASNTEPGDAFGDGLAVSADGSTVVVSADGEDSGVPADPADNSQPGAGAVYVFTRAGGTWIQRAYVKASNAEAGDTFGDSLKLSHDGTTLCVSASFEDGIAGDPTSNAAPDSGAVYVFARVGDIWMQEAYLKPSTGGSGDYFGDHISLSRDGSTLAIGADSEDSAARGIGGDPLDNSAVEAGAVYVFTREAGTWTQRAYVKASNADAGDHFGDSGSILFDGSLLAIGAYQEASSATGVDGNELDNSAPEAGAVYVFQ